MKLSRHDDLGCFPLVFSRPFQTAAHFSKKNTNTRHYMKNIKKKGVRATLATQSRTERVLKTIQCIYDARGQDSIWEPIWHVQPIRKWHAPLRWPASLASLASRSNNKFLLVSLLPLPPSLCVSIILTRQPITNQFIFSTFSLLLLTSIRSNCLWIVVTAMKKNVWNIYLRHFQYQTAW